jgi:hypothetical protein
VHISRVKIIKDRSSKSFVQITPESELDFTDAELDLLLDVSQWQAVDVSPLPELSENLLCYQIEETKAGIFPMNSIDNSIIDYGDYENETAMFENIALIDRLQWYVSNREYFNTRKLSVYPQITQAPAEVPPAAGPIKIGMVFRQSDVLGKPFDYTVIDMNERCVIARNNQNGLSAFFWRETIESLGYVMPAVITPAESSQSIVEISQSPAESSPDVSIQNIAVP